MKSKKAKPRARCVWLDRKTLQQCRLTGGHAQECKSTRKRRARTIKSPPSIQLLPLTPELISAGELEQQLSERFPEVPTPSWEETESDPFYMSNDELPDEPWWPNPVKEFEAFQIQNWYQALEKLGYRVTLANADDNTVTDTSRSQPPVVQSVLKGMTGVDQVQPSGFVKHDEGKPKFSLVPTLALLEVAKVFTAGAKKYPPRNYLKGTNWTRYMDAGMRHDNSWMLGDDMDKDTGTNALANSIASRMIALELQLRGLGTDDRK